MSSENESREPVRVGVLGYGLGGRVFHCPFVSAIPGLKLTAILQRHGDEAGAAYPEAHIARDAEEVLSDPQIDLVVVSTPNDTHFELAKKALLAGKHCVVDKPLAATSDEARVLAYLARQTDRLLIPFHNRRFDGDFLTVKHLLQSETLGRIVEITSRFDRFRPSPRANSWKEVDGPMSGILFDLGPHLLDQALALFGPPSTIEAQLYRDRDHTAVVDAFDVLLSYQALGLRYRCASTLIAADPAPRFRVNGTRGSYVKYGVDPQEPAVVAGRRPPLVGTSGDWLTEPQDSFGRLTIDAEGNPSKLTRTAETTIPGDYRRFYQNVLGAIRHDEELAITAEDGYRSIRLLELAQQSHDEQRSVPVVFSN